MFLSNKPKTSDWRESKPHPIQIYYRDTVDPMIEVTCLENKKYTSTKNDIGPTGIVVWSEHLFYENKRLVILRFK